MRQLLVAAALALGARGAAAQSATTDEFCSAVYGDLVGDLGGAAGNVSSLQSGVAALGDGLSLADDSVNKLIDMMQSYRGENLLLKELQRVAALGDADTAFQGNFGQEYATAMVPLAAPGIALCVLTLLSCPFCFFCANACCCRNRKAPSEYSFLAKMLPVVFYMLFAIVASALALVAISNVGKMTDGAVGTVCEFGKISARVDVFLDEIMTPLLTFQADSNVVLDNVTAVMSGATAVQTKLSLVSGALSGLQAFVAAVSLPSGVSGGLISAMNATVASAATQVAAQAGPVVTLLDSTRQSVNDNVLSTRTAVAEAMAVATDAVTSVQNYTLELDELVIDAKTTADGPLDTSKLGSYLFFSTVFVALAAGVLVTITLFAPIKPAKCISRVALTFSFLCTYLFMILLFLLGGIFLPVSAAFSDVCVVLDEIPQNFSFYLGPFIPMDSSSGGGAADIDPVALLSGCFASPSPPLMQTLGLVDASEYASVFDDFSGSRPNLTSALDFSDLDGLVTQVADLDRESFGLFAQNMTDAVAALNVAAGGGSFTEADCTPTALCDRACVTGTGGACEVTSSPAQLVAARDAVVDLAEAQTSVDALVAGLQMEIGLVEANVTDFSAAVRALDAQLGGIEGELQPLIAQVATLETLGNCSFIAETYYGVHEQLCDKSLTPLMVLSLLLLFIALCGLPIIITSQYIHVRHFGSRKPSTVFATSTGGKR